jgi:hypothetical protein
MSSEPADGSLTSALGLPAEWVSGDE